MCAALRTARGGRPGDFCLVRRLLEAGHVVLGVLPIGGVLRLLPGVASRCGAVVERRARRVGGVASPWGGAELTAVLHRSQRVDRDARESEMTSRTETAVRSAEQTQN